MFDPQNLKKILRSRLHDNQLHCFRLLHGRGKCYEGLEKVNIEWYPPYVLVQNFADELPLAYQEMLAELFDECTWIDAILIQSREWPDFVTRTFKSRKEIEVPLVFNAKLDSVLSTEIKLGANRNTGVFLDMRAGWNWIAERANNKRVLNLFCYTGVFSLFALESGAARVDNVDMAANVLRIAQRNHQTNDYNVTEAAFFKRNALDSQRWFESREPYDLMIIDPPPYQKKAFKGWPDYLKLLRHCEKALAPGGQLLCALNNPQVTLDQFEHDLRAHFGESAALNIVERSAEIEELDPTRGLKLIAVST